MSNSNINQYKEFVSGKDEFLLEQYNDCNFYKNVYIFKVGSYIETEGVYK